MMNVTRSRSISLIFTATLAMGSARLHKVCDVRGSTFIEHT
jgi:hypothetical protein